MIGQYYTSDRMRKCLRRSDFWKSNYFKEDNNDLRDVEDVLRKISDDVNKDGYQVTLHKFQGNKKEMYSVKTLADKLVLRKIFSDFSRIYKVSSPSRRSISSQVLSLLKDSSPYSIVKTDISNCYESISVDRALKNVKSDGYLSSKSMKILYEMYKGEGNESKLKRGLSPSAVIAEYYMQQMDREIKKIEGVYYYARFVDDIIIFASKIAEEICERVKKIAQDLGLDINTSKTISIDLPCKEKSGDESILKQKNCNKHKQKVCGKHEFNYLGYKYIVDCLPTDITKERGVDVSISDKKIKKIKTKMIKALLAYAKDNNFALLKIRLQFLSGNYRVDSGKKREKVNDQSEKTKKTNSNKPWIMSGLRYNYPLLTEPTRKYLFKDLNNFVKQSIYHYKKSGKISLTSDEEGILSKISFAAGYDKKIMHNFSIKKLAEISECWKNG